MEYQGLDCFCSIYCLPPAERVKGKICSLDNCKYKEAAENVYKEMSLEEANQLPTMFKQRWVEVHNATANLYFIKNGKIEQVEPAGWWR